MRTAILLIVASCCFLASAWALELEKVWEKGEANWNNGAVVFGCAAAGDRLYTVDSGFLREWDASDGKPGRFVRLERPDAGPAVSADGSLLAVSAGMELALYRLPGLEEAGRRRFEKDVAGAIAFAGDELVVGTKGGAVWKGKMGDEESWKKAEGDFEWNGIVVGAAVSSSGHIAVCGGDRVRVFDSSLALQWEKAVKGGGLIGCFFVETDAGKWLVAASYAQTFFFDMETGEEREALKNEGGMVGVAAAPWGFAAVYRNGRVAVFDLTEAVMKHHSWMYGEPLYSPAAAGDRIYAFTSSGRCVAFDRDGRTLNSGKALPPVLAVGAGKRKGEGGWAASGSTKGLSVFDADDGTPLPTGEDYKGAVLRIREAGDGRLLALFHSRKVCLFDVESGRTLASFRLEVFPTDAVRTGDGILVCSAPARAVFFSADPPEGEERKAEKLEGLPRYRYWAFASDEKVMAETKSHELAAVSLKDRSVKLLGGHPGGDGGYGAVRDVSVSGDAAASISSRSLVFWSLAEAKAAAPPIDLSAWGTPRSVSLLDGKRAAVLFGDGRLVLLDRSGALLASLEPGRPGAALCRCGGGFVVGYRDGGTALFKVVE